MSPNASTLLRGLAMIIAAAFACTELEHAEATLGNPHGV